MHSRFSLRQAAITGIATLLLITTGAHAEQLLAFPGAMGPAATTPGGRGGKIIRVTTLAAEGPGSLLAALQTQGPRIVVFEVGGVIDMARQEIKITEPYLTIAGQTAPSPGITLIRTGIDVATHDVVIRHIRVRTGIGGGSLEEGWEPDAFSGQGAHNLIVDHCSMTWAIDENLSASGPRLRGKTPEDWGKATSRRVTFSNNIIAEGLAYATHAKGEHSKGSLIHDHATDILIVGNLYAHNHERSPLFKGGVQGMVLNNLIYNPGARAAHYNLIAEEWRGHEYQTGRMVLMGNVLRGGPSTLPGLPFFMLGGSGDLELYMEDNIAVDWTGQPLPQVGRYTTAPAKLIDIERPALPLGVQLLSATEVQDAVIQHAGARPWDRDAIDSRIVADTIEGRGEILDSEDQVGGFPQYAPTRQPFVDSEWDLRYMIRKQPRPGEG